MTEFDKIDKVLRFVIDCEQPPKRKATEIANELNFKLTTKETIEILDKLTKDGFVIKEIQSDDFAYYFSSFEGRLFFKNGGYSKLHLQKKIKTIANKFIIILNTINIVAIIYLTFLNYRATDKANDNKEEVSKLNSTIKHLTNSNDSLRNIIIINATKKQDKNSLQH